MLKKSFSLFIVLFICTTLFADGVQPEGSGTEADPYQVEILDNLLWISTNSYSWSSYFVQIANIDATDTQNWNNGEGFEPIGKYEAHFTGTYNGQDHIIDGLFINRETEYHVGLFGFTEGTVIENLGLTNTNVLGNHNVGGLAGYLRIQCFVNNCYVEGTVSGDSSIGGLVGDNRNSLISDCYTSCFVSGNEPWSQNMGGLVGVNRSDSIIENCYALGSVNGYDEIGGITGFNLNSTIISCYATGDIEGTTSFPGEMIGGLVGLNNGNSIIENSYFVGSVSGNIQSGGLVGQNNSFIIDESCATIINSFYNYDTVLINGEHIITIGALYDEQFNTWLDNDLYLNINDYLTFDGENYLISDINDFKQLLAFGQFEEYSYALTNEINLENEENFYIPYFTGSLNGDSNIISNLNISTGALFRYGLFCNLFNASVENLILDNVNIDCSDEVYLGGGGLSGSSYNSIISNVQINGSIGNENFSPNGFSLTGGLVGFCGDTTISDCFVSGFCYGPILGGLIGYSSNSTISNCSVNNSKVGSGVGGLVSINNNSTISNCFAEGTIEMIYDSGGLIGLNENNSTIINSHYNFDSVLFNGENILTIGALYETEYNTWINNNLYLNIDEYLSSNGDYYLINNIDDFKLLLAFGLSSEYNFLLMNDINLNSDNDFYIPYFAGYINGNDNSIYNLNLDYEFLNNLGLFGYTNNATIENTKLENVSIELMGSYIGSLVGYCDNETKINNCYANGIVNGISIIGGLVGIGDNYSEVNNCFSDCIISGNSNIGGLIGRNYNFSSINNCFSTGSVDAAHSAGGLVGHNRAIIVNCYSFGSVVGDWDTGGLVGEVNEELSIIENSFWDTQTSGQTTSAGGTGKTTAEMQDVATYTSLATVGLDEPWDFVGNPFDDVGNEDYWNIDSGINDGYPYFANPFTGVDDEEVIIVTPKTPKLIGNYPNPFNPETMISFSIPEDSKVKLMIYNTKGQKVKTVANNLFEKGIYSIFWSGDDDNGKLVSSGVYFYKLYVNGKTVSVKKCMLLK